MSRSRFAIVGDNCIDRFRPSGMSMIGGNAVNVAVQLALLGETAHYFGAVGLDPDGRRTIEALASRGVNVHFVQQKAGTTAYTDIDVLPSGERVFAHEDFGVCAGYRPSVDDLHALDHMDHVHIGWMDDNGELRKRLVAQGVSVSQDITVNADPVHLGVAGLTIAFGSAGEDDAAAADLVARLLGDGAKLAVVTKGARGACASDGIASYAVEAEKIEVVDTTGAGDSFIAGFLSAYRSGSGIPACLAAGCRTAARTCNHIGGFPQSA
ncbi:PfkB family carbohydrate kinase [Rhizobium glycinendophyticum]|uniref:Fructoselysine 6-kinase n=1 Tax=Rhizobium glycinendophyticum TaxID=2589807 RepID=A0A504UCI4_9HYPH|nr:PfkB family carbohydrate kinase [Rhizobium glycinendophyticum]TPP04601.1 fructoselysine 6-kinase [Rhizobium glycinendophyticum]